MKVDEELTDLSVEEIADGEFGNIADVRVTDGTKSCRRTRQDTSSCLMS
jgi:hypothetical protein